MTTEITLASIAERFRRFNNFSNPEPESFNVWFEDRSSMGNRHRDWKGVWAYRNYDGDDKVLETLDDVYEKIKFGACDWSHLFEAIHYGLITGPQTLAAVEECLEILRNDNPPEDDGTKVRHVNRLGGVNYVSKPTFHDWNLTSKLGKIMSDGFFADRKNKNLYSSEWTYVYNSHSGWSRST